MDDFAVDLDKVLDDFELSEGGGGSSAPVTESNGNPSEAMRGINPPGSRVGALCPQQAPAVGSSFQPNNVNNQNFGRPTGLPAPFNQAYPPPQRMDCMVSPTHNANIQETNYVNACNNVPPSRGQSDMSQGSGFYHPQPSMPVPQAQWGIQRNNPLPYNVNLISEGGVMAHGEQINGSLMRRLSNERPELLQSMAEKTTPLPPYPGDIRMSGQVVSRIHPDVIPTSINNDVEAPNHHLPKGLGREDENSGSPDFIKTHSDSPSSSSTTQPSQTSSLTNGDSSEYSPEHQMSSQDSRQSSLSPEPAPPHDPEAMNVDSPSHGPQETTLKLNTEFGDAPSEPSMNGTVPILGSGMETTKDDEKAMEEMIPNECDTNISFSDELSELTPPPSLHRHPEAEISFGFLENQDIDDEDEMDQYLAEIEKIETEPQPNKPEPQTQPHNTSTDHAVSEGSQSGNVQTFSDPVSKNEVAVSAVSEPVVNTAPPEQCDSGISLERILMPDIMSPIIATPMDDAGFSKVPGYKPPSALTSLQEASLNEVEEEEEEEAEETGDFSHSSLNDGLHKVPSYASVMEEKATLSALMSETPGTLAQTVSPCGTMGQVQAPDIKKFNQLPRASEMVMGSQDLSNHPSSLPGLISVSFPTKEEIESKPVASLPASDPSPQAVTGAGARPKEMVPQGRKSRPNSLIGLSKPDLNIAVVTSEEGSNFSMTSNGSSGTSNVLGNSDSMSSNQSGYGNTQETSSQQLAQKVKVQQQKMHFNLDMGQQGEMGGFVKPQVGMTSPGELWRGQESPYGVGVMTNRAQLAGGIDINLPHQTNNQGLQAANNGPNASQHNTETEMVPATVSQQIPVSEYSPCDSYYNTQSQQGQLPDESTEGPESYNDTDSMNGSKLKRPTTLSLMPRDEYDLARDKDSVDDDSATGEDLGLAHSGSSGGQSVPYNTDDEMSEPPGATASGPGLDIMYSPPEVGPGAFSPAPPCSSNANVAITQLGKVAPRWVPDSEALNCMQCEAKFTFTKRRHHCRACGKVFCSTCCNLKIKLQYMDNKEARVCSKCYQDIIRAQAYERMHSPSRAPNPNNPAEYCSTIPPLQQAAASLNAPPPTVMVPIGVLRKEGSQRNREPKQVMFSDGIRPGGDLTELDNSDVRIPIRRHTRTSKKVERTSPSTESSSDSSQAKSPSPKTRTKRTIQPRNACLIPDTGLPPLVLSTGNKTDLILEEFPNPDAIMEKIKSTEDPSPVVFAINRNLFVLVKILNLDCCVNRVCWCFSTRGMCTVGQEEIVIVLECLPDEAVIPRDIFCHFNAVYDDANKGNTVSHLGHTIFGQSFLESRDHCGFLYVRPTFQCVQKLLLPSPPFVFGLLLQKWETPWAKVFPIRLMLRLGAEYRYYPCPLVSVRFRKPVFGEIGHTIMNLLADFRNYQYMLPQIRGVIIHMEEKKTFINFPRNRYDEIMKVITNSNDHVMALGANFSTDADSHLVCIQNEDGNYQTQAINIQNKPRKVTGASFVVFNGALKTSSGLRAKSSIVEDGLMVQITNESMAALKAALLDMRDYTIGCGAIDAPAPDEQIIVQWVDEDHKVNVGVKSPIDGRPMDGIESIHIHNSTDYVGESRTIRWTEVYFIQNDEANSSRCEPVDLSRLAETLAQACCIALTPKLDKLKEAGLTKIGLRCTIDRDNVGYEVGSMSERLPDYYMNDLDNELIPVIHNAGSHSQDGPVVLELIFHIIE